MKTYKLLVFVCLFPLISTKGQTLDTYLKRAQSHIANKNFPAAILYLDTAIILNPNIDSLYTYRAYCYLGVSKYKLAFDNSNKALKLNSKNYYVYYLRGFSNAKIPIDDSLKNIILHQNLNDTLYLKTITKKYTIIFEGYSSEIFDYGFSIDDYTKTIEINPKFSDAYIQRAELFIETLQSEKALIDYNKSIELKPDFSDYYYKRGLYFKKENETKKALADFNKAIELKSSPYYYANRGYLKYEQINDKLGACEDLKKAMSLGIFIDDIDKYCK